MRYGRWLLITPAKIEAAEAWSAQFGTVGVFISRLLPVIRHLIGIPAGIVRLDFRWYSLATLAGSLIWCCVLAWVGVKAGQDPALMRGDLHALTLWLGGGSLGLGAIYWFFVHRHMK
jgi:membrane protein DedA with SNARE-associated domain